MNDATGKTDGDAAEPTGGTKEPSREGNGGRIVLLTILALVLLVGGAYVAAYVGAGAKVPRGTTVAGVEIGGLEKAAAVDRLEDALAERDAIEVTIGDKQTTLSAAEAGISIDAPASVEAAGGGKSWSPGRLWDYYTGGGDIDPVVTVDEDAFAATIEELNTSHGTAPKDGAVVFTDGKAGSTAGASGTGIEADPARDALVAAYVDGTTADLDVVELEPDIDQADVQRALNEFANPAVSGPVVLTFEDHEVRLTPEEFTPALTLVPVDGALQPELDKEKLDDLVRSRFSGDMGQPVDATVALVDGKPTVVPSEPGVDYEPAEIAKAFMDVVTKTSGRTAAVPSHVTDPEFTTEDAKALNIVEEVSSFTTYYPHAAYRNTNLSRAGELIDGTVLKPGETFSLNGIVGERTAANGFAKGTIISNGVYRQDYGGGVSQMATTVFNAMFFAGLEDVEHKPHSFYIDRYPVGREATVVWGALDMSFKNDTDHGVLIDVVVKKSTPGSRGSVTVTMYSTKTWDITTSTSDRYRYTSPGTRELTVADCTPNGGQSGFDIDVFRYFHKPGQSAVERTEKFHTRYLPADKVVCK
ncbi:VanW family protein [Nocardioides sp. AE5]|uniref:VanW family protein n=1 Tax=Nocardioides sp. AE5 TaxID=2962573 RepID=UPI0028826097|nr:VanW family protein [Nocardioides sp. AE5]MDT0202131.1 VanW family protein [Nocardioides sp. AE5]